MSQVMKTTFTCLPREIRDCIYNAILVNIDDYITSCPPTEPDYSEINPIYTQEGIHSDALPFLTLVQKWASKSRIAREACAAFYGNNIFIFTFYSLPKLFDTPRRLSQGIPLPFETRLLGLNLRTVIIQTTTVYSLLLYEALDHPTHPIMDLLRCPSLRKVDIVVDTGNESADALVDVIPILANIAPVCKALIQALGTSGASTWRPWYALRLPRMANPHPGLKVCLRQVIDAYIDEWYDVTWMWEVPGAEVRRIVEDGKASSEEKIKVTVDNGGKEEYLKEELRKASEGLVLHRESKAMYLHEHQGPRR